MKGKCPVCGNDLTLRKEDEFYIVGCPKCSLECFFKDEMKANTYYILPTLSETIDNYIFNYDDTGDKELLLMCELILRDAVQNGVEGAQQMMDRFEDYLRDELDEETYNSIIYY